MYIPMVSIFLRGSLCFSFFLCETVDYTENHRGATEIH